ncbi:MAG: metallophosphoesterase [Salinarimonadaceae bacterium]|nr:MAG: metallophosphoesterase [Salinarimonadaceae bacterium]
MKIGLVSDAHGHVRALERAIGVLRDARAEEILFLGDALGYIDCVDTVQLILDEGLLPLAGNHERMILDGTTPADRDEIYRHSSIESQLSPATRSVLETWPSFRLLHDGAVLAVHGSPADPVNGYVYPDSELEGFATPLGVRFVSMGHTHHAMVRRHNGILFINPGSCGLPRDIRSSGSVAVLDLVRHDAEIIRFDISDVSADFLNKVHESVRSAWLKREADSVARR